MHFHGSTAQAGPPISKTIMCKMLTFWCDDHVAMNNHHTHMLTYTHTHTHTHTHTLWLSLPYTYTHIDTDPHILAGPT